MQTVLFAQIYSLQVTTISTIIKMKYFASLPIEEQRGMSLFLGGI